MVTGILTMYNSLSSTISLHHECGGVQTFLRHLQEHGKDSRLEGSKARWQYSQKNPQASTLQQSEGCNGNEPRNDKICG